MCLKKIFGNSKTKSVDIQTLSLERIAQHEAAHGIVWYLFKNNWIVNSLTIERSLLPNDNMKGALHITANFNVENEVNIERANELLK